MRNRIIEIGNLKGAMSSWKSPQRGRVYSKNGISPTLNTCSWGGHEVKIVERNIVAMRGKNPENPSDRNSGILTEQRLELKKEMICNTLTSVQKDNMIETNNYQEWRIRKLTEREYWRLMGFSDDDFEKAASVNSKSQLYKQAGNSIALNCLVGIFSQLGIKGVQKWNEGLKDKYV